MIRSTGPRARARWHAERFPPGMELALKLTALVLVTTYMLQVGLATPRGALAVATRRKGAIARAVVLMLVVGPLGARALVAALELPPRPAVALVLLALAGVVPLAPRGARSARGDVPYAVVVTFTLGILAAFTAAPSARLLLGYWGPLDVPTLRLLGQIVLVQAVPLGLGLLLRARPHARAIEKVVGAVNVAVSVVIVVAALVLLPRTGAVRSLGLLGALAALLFAGIMAALGYVLGGRDPAARRSLASVANMPNVALALLVVAGAGLDQGFAVAVVGLFVIRLLAALVTQKVLARASRRAPPRAAQPQVA